MEMTTGRALEHIQTLATEMNKIQEDYERALVRIAEIDADNKRLRGERKTESVTIYFHSHADTGEHLGTDWSSPPASRLDVVGLRMDHSIDLLLGAMEDADSSISRSIEEFRAEHWPEWRETSVIFRVYWEDHEYYADSFEIEDIGESEAE